LRAALVASCLRGALPPVDLRAVCFVRAMVRGTRGEKEGRRRRTRKALRRRAVECEEAVRCGEGRRGRRVQVTDHRITGHRSLALITHAARPNFHSTSESPSSLLSHTRRVNLSYFHHCLCSCHLSCLLSLVCPMPIHLDPTATATPLPRLSSLPHPKLRTQPP
jgi:hypothetical protein